MKLPYHALRRSPLRGLLRLLLVAGVTSGAVSQGREPAVTKVSSIPVQGRSEAVLEDVCGNGLVLLNDIGIVNDHRPSLRLWDLASSKPAFQVPMDAWVKEKSALSKAQLPGRDGPFRCLDGGKRLIAMQGMYLVLIDVEKQEEVARVLPSKDLNDTTSPLFHVMWHVTARTLDVSPKTGLIAAAYNWGVKPRVFLYTADLRRVVNRWELPRYMEDIRWSPDGQSLAVLYSSGFDAKGNFIGADLEFRLTGIPDVEVFDASSGKSLVSFFSGDMEAKIAFNPDGTRLYTVSLTKYNIATRKEAAIRVFSSSDGTLLETMSVHPWGVRDSFALSPDGRWIVADASTSAPAFFLKEIFAEERFYRKWARFVIFDTQTGKLLFEHHERTAGEAGVLYPMRFGFSPDSRLLLVDPNFAGWGCDERVDVYSLDALRRPESGRR